MVNPELQPLTEKQQLTICNLQQFSQQAEDALSQSMETLQQNLADTLSAGSQEVHNVANYMGQMSMAMGKLSTLENFVRQVVVMSFGFLTLLYNHMDLFIFLILSMTNESSIGGQSPAPDVASTASYFDTTTISKGFGSTRRLFLTFTCLELSLDCPTSRLKSQFVF